MQSCIGWSGSVEFILFNVSAIWGVKMRLAVVSSDGKNVDLHLGKGHTIYIYDYEDELSFVEMRKLQMDEDSKHQGGEKSVYYIISLYIVNFKFNRLKLDF